MGKYIVKRVILAIFTIFIISLITFFAMNAIPGGPFNSEKAKSPAVMKELEARYGLDQPLIVQYKNYMAGVLHGDFGVSLKTDRPISDIIGESFPISAKLGLLAALTAIVFGVVLDSSADAKQVAGSSYSILRHTDYVDAVICHRYVITLFLLYKAWCGAGFQLRKQHDITSGAVTVTFTDGIYYKTYKDFNA